MFLIINFNNEFYYVWKSKKIPFLLFLYQINEFAVYYPNLSLSPYGGEKASNPRGIIPDWYDFS